MGFTQAEKVSLCFVKICLKILLQVLNCDCWAIALADKQESFFT